MSNHTPGPWVCHSGMVWKTDKDQWRGPPSIPIAHMDRESGNGTSPTERDANAVLIAQAPELLELLTDVGNALIDRLPSGHPDFALVQKAV